MNALMHSTGKKNLQLRLAKPKQATEDKET